MKAPCVYSVSYTLEDGILGKLDFMVCDVGRSYLSVSIFFEPIQECWIQSGLAWGEGGVC
ncbi:hypothetical protein Rhal01_01474 [Rubritalea halochordaticola]|uniref:Uncharacterized protein n=1 Tax=Rubritalea halochordaticola TaxID=714537 RepID=A0ABP9UXW3_9BACT